MEEIFKNINYRGADLTVSNFGKVIVNGKELRWRYNADGYTVVSLKTEKGWRSAAVHRIVATAFVPNPDNKPEVNHLDYDRKNPRADNLEWVTRKENIEYSKCHMPDYRGKNNPNYGNRTLHEKYLNDKELSKQKQGRPGVMNGRSTPITVLYDGEFVKKFDYIVPCCQYFIDIGVTKAKNIESVRGRINSCIRNNKLYKGHYTFIKG